MLVYLATRYIICIDRYSLCVQINEIYPGWHHRIILLNKFVVFVISLNNLITNRRSMTLLNISTLQDYSPRTCVLGLGFNLFIWHILTVWNSITSTSFVFTELANTMKYGGGFLYNLVFTEWRHCVSQSEVWGRGCYVTLFSQSDVAAFHRIQP